MKKPQILTIILILTLASCGNKNEFTIEGTLDDGANKTLYIEELTPADGSLFIDSVKTDSKGHFKFSYTMPYLTFYTLHCTPVDYIVLLPHPKEKIKIDGRFGHLSETYTVKGSPESILLWQIQDYSNQSIPLLEELRFMNDYNKNNLDSLAYLEAKKQTDSIYWDAYNMQRTMISNFLIENAGSLTTLIALYKPFNVNHPIVMPDADFEIYEMVLDALECDSLNAENPHTQHFRTTVEQLRYRRSHPAQINTNE